MRGRRRLPWPRRATSRADGRLERLGAYDADPTAPTRPALARSPTPRTAGFERLLSEHRAAWARRWEAADIVDRGRPRAAARDPLRALPPDGVGRRTRARRRSARAASPAPAYRGHVFWDSDVFVLPFLAATHPAAARAMLEYRIRRLPAARAAARRARPRGRPLPLGVGAATGVDVTPASRARPRPASSSRSAPASSRSTSSADVAWAAALLRRLDRRRGRSPPGPGASSSSRRRATGPRASASTRDGRAHIYGVIGPDEYHEPVDDNAFTNVHGALEPAPRRPSSTASRRRASARRWLALADALVDGYDPATGVYEQFAGFFGLEPLVIAEVAPRRPIAADLLLGRERVARRPGAQAGRRADAPPPRPRRGRARLARCRTSTSTSRAPRTAARSRRRSTRRCSREPDGSDEALERCGSRRGSTSTT